MSDNEISYKDVLEYERFFNLVPPFLLERFAKKNKNLVLKFKPKVEKYLDKMDDNHKNKLEAILNTDVDELQSIMKEAYAVSNKKQYKILANPKYKQFIEYNINEIRKMME